LGTPTTLFHGGLPPNRVWSRFRATRPPVPCALNAPPSWVFLPPITPLRTLCLCVKPFLFFLLVRQHPFESVLFCNLTSQRTIPRLPWVVNSRPQLRQAVRCNAYPPFSTFLTLFVSDPYKCPGVYPSSGSSKIFPIKAVTFSPTLHHRNSFSCNTYGPFRN
jgi:hypothetical protein